ncbi:phosphate acetyltransferase [Enterobacteriaceae endosymbiont of Macroplea appendiculata]|uniref:phosphate acetyltransferase n=1 Tax=Enterobacteriaceae endosymbiont of Macroplea appendiculata TaxID=2675790 RepID=UPI0014563C1D|nr:phosphate acetyltransferase [Enterobacteriaceae endosymbiont of Macroplea appendiculata]
MNKVIISIPINVNINFFNNINITLLNKLQSQFNKIILLNPIFKTQEQTCIYNKSFIEKKYVNVKYINPIIINNISALNDSLYHNKVINSIIHNFYKYKNQNYIMFITGFIAPQHEILTFFLNCKIANILNAEIIFITASNNIDIDFKLIQNNINYISKKVITNTIIRNNMKIIIQNYDTQNLFFNIYNQFSYYTTCIHHNSLKLSSENNHDNGIYPIIYNTTHLLGITIDHLCQYLCCSIINKNQQNALLIKNIIFVYEDFIMQSCCYNMSLLIISCNNNQIIKQLHNIISKSDVQPITYNVLLTNISNINNITKNTENKLIKKIILLANKKNMNIIYTKYDNNIIYNKLQYFYKSNFVYLNFSFIEQIIQYLSIFLPKNIFIQKKHIIYNNPEIFKYLLIQKAIKLHKTILLPEGEEIRTIQAASICAKKKIANCILLGHPQHINNIAKEHDINIQYNNIQIINPDSIRNNYIEQLFLLRKEKGISIMDAKQLLKNNMFVATMMLKNKQIDGIVAGASQTTANTIRPALQIIKTVPQYSIISSIFFMLLPQKILIYGDCAINPNPNYKQLAEIALQTVETATLFNIDAKIAMISYATGTSSNSLEVKKVYKATQLIHHNAPQILVDGPLQYDAAIDISIGRYKAPNSNIAGHANTIIFPDLNTGNTTYKAVQRTANIVSIGPILQGIQQPVNDLSRGSSIEDIVYTIAVTAIQADKKSI